MDFFQLMQDIAINYIPISHTSQKPRFFKAYGLEDLYNFDDRLSSVNGTVLIAVDGIEAESTMNRADGLFYSKRYSVIVAKPCNNDRTETIDAAYRECEAHCKEIRNYLLQQEELRGILEPEMSVNGVGPIGDNFHGCILTFGTSEAEDFFTDETLWKA